MTQDVPEPAGHSLSQRDFPGRVSSANAEASAAKEAEMSVASFIVGGGVVAVVQAERRVILDLEFGGVVGLLIYTPWACQDPQPTAPLIGFYAPKAARRCHSRRRTSVVDIWLLGEPRLAEKDVFLYMQDGRTVYPIPHIIYIGH